MPRWISDGESAPPYEPIQPATESMSVPKAQKISFVAKVVSPLSQDGHVALHRQARPAAPTKAIRQPAPCEPPRRREMAISTAGWVDSPSPSAPTSHDTPKDHHIRDIFQIPLDLVVDRWASDGESSSHRPFLCQYDVWTMVRGQIREKITSVLSIA